MASVNIIINRIIIPLMIFAYLLFLIYDYKLFDNDNFKNNVDRHKVNIIESSSINALIIGGSNAAFGLSAEQLSLQSPYNWYNLSLMHEGFSDSNYHKFVQDSSGEYRSNIKFIVYSPINHFRSGVIKERQRYTGPVYGSNDFRLRPRMSALSHLKLILNKNYNNVKKGFPLPNQYGDFMFKDYICQRSKSELPFEHEEIDLSALYIASNIQNYLSFFPNAKLLLSHPSVYYGSLYNEELITLFQKNLNNKIYQILDHNLLEKAENRVFIANQEVIKNSLLVCEGKHHLNELGRAHRTNFILRKLNIENEN